MSVSEVGIWDGPQRPVGDLRRNASKQKHGLQKHGIRQILALLDQSPRKRVYAAQYKDVEGCSQKLATVRKGRLVIFVRHISGSDAQAEMMV